MKLDHVERTYFDDISAIFSLHPWLWNRINPGLDKKAKIIHEEKEITLTRTNDTNHLSYDSLQK